MAYYETALAIHLTIRGQRGSALNLLNITDVYLRQQSPTVKSLIREAFTITTSLNILPFMLASLTCLAWWYLNQGNAEHAAEC